MNSGPSATFGIMLRLTRSGMKVASAMLDQVKTMAIVTPTTTASR
jgi:hypothetical protein